tara:strand:+ start:113 stop:334 length:222 start_codon:yes stop_codon:yes gene_type:complete
VIVESTSDWKISSEITLTLLYRKNFTKNAPIAYTTIEHKINNKKKFKLKMDSIDNSPKVANAIKQITSDITIE